MSAPHIWGPAMDNPSQALVDDTTMLKVTGLNAHYGECHVLHGVDFEVNAGELVTLIGNNGAGKTTTLRAIMGLVKRQGSVTFGSTELTGLVPEQIARLGIAYVPEERNIFASLTVEENLMLPPVVRPGGMEVAEIYRLFPNLEERRRSQGTHLSGGEQQMLAIARIMRTGAHFILLDEPTEGLAPVLVEKIGAAIGELKKKGLTIVLVEQNFHFARSIADRHYVVEDGRIVDMIPNALLDQNDVVEKLNNYLGI